MGHYKIEAADCANFQNGKCNLYDIEIIVGRIDICKSSCFIPKRQFTCADCDWNDPNYCNKKETRILDSTLACSQFKQTPNCPKCGKIMFTGTFNKNGVLIYDQTYRCLLCDPIFKQFSIIKPKEMRDEQT